MRDEREHSLAAVRFERVAWSFERTRNSFRRIHGILISAMMISSPLNIRKKSRTPVNSARSLYVMDALSEPLT